MMRSKVSLPPGVAPRPVMLLFVACFWLPDGDARAAADNRAPDDGGPSARGPASIDYASRVWQTEEGLPNSKVQALAQTPDGYLWVGTHDGLARFDGMRFTVYNAENRPALRNTSITALCAGRQDSLYVGTEDGLAVVRDGAFCRLDTNDGLAGNTVTGICLERSGSAPPLV
jgi:hypothetical protein